MIRDLIAWLKTDSTLADLLYANVGNGKMFPMRADKPKGERTPYILYSQSGVGSGDPILEESVIQLSIITEKYDNGQEIAYRLDELLDGWEKLNKNVPSTNYYIYYSRKVGGNDAYESDTKLYNSVRLFNIKYKRKNGG